MSVQSPLTFGATLYIAPKAHNYAEMLSAATRMPDLAAIYTRGEKDVLALPNIAEAAARDFARQHQKPGDVFVLGKVDYPDVRSLRQRLDAFAENPQAVPHYEELLPPGLEA